MSFVPFAHGDSMTQLRRIAGAIFSIALTMCTGPATARAEVISVYGTFSPLRVSNVPNGNTTTGTYWAQGVGGGITLTPFHLGPVSLGLDLRGSTARQRQGADTLLAGIKLGGKLPLIPFKPYVQASGGYLGARPTFLGGPAPIAGTSPNVGFWVYEFLGGVDFALLPHLDVRLIEVGGGQGYYKSGLVSGTPSISFVTVNTGVVIHF